MTRSLLVAVSPGEAWAAGVDEDRLVDLAILRASSTPRVGEILLGRVVALKPELPAALVEIGLDRPAFLSAEHIKRGERLTEGQAVIVQVIRDARADKAVGVTARPRLAGALLDLMPGGSIEVAARGLEAGEQQRLRTEIAALAQPGEGFRLHAAAGGVAPTALARDAAALRARWRAIGAARAVAEAPARLEPQTSPMAALLAALPEPLPDRIVLDDRAAFAEARAWLRTHRPELAARIELHAAVTPLFEHEGIAADIETALAPRVALPGGGSITIETTAAAILIDVDSGGAPALAANLAAAREAGHQIRLRNLAGPIVIDFIAMKAQRARVAAALQAPLAGDLAEPEFLGWTRLGHFELVRRRRGSSLDEVLFERDAGAGRVKTALTVALEALRAMARQAAASPASPPVLRLAPDVAAVLREGAARKAREQLEARLGRPIALEIQPGRPRATFGIG